MQIQYISYYKILFAQQVVVKVTINQIYIAIHVIIFVLIVHLIPIALIAQALIYIIILVSYCVQILLILK